MLPFLTLVAIAAAMMGMLNSLQHYFVPALAPAIFNVATIAGALRAGAARCRRSGWPPIIGDRHRHRCSADSAQVALQWPAAERAKASATGRFWISRDPRLARAPAADGPRHARPRRDAGQPVRQHAARHQRGHRRGLVADLRVPADVPADRPVRRLDRHRGAAAASRAHAALDDLHGDPRHVSRGVG